MISCSTRAKCVENTRFPSVEVCDLKIAVLFVLAYSLNPDVLRKKRHLRISNFEPEVKHLKASENSLF